MQKLSLIFEKILFLLILVLVTFVPLYPKFPVINIPKTFVAIRIEDFLVAFILVLWVWYMFASRKLASLFKEPIFLLLALYFGISAISLFSAIFVTKSIDPHLGIFHWLRRVELMMLLPVVWTVVSTQKQIKTILWVLSCVVFLVCVYAFGQTYLNWPVISTGNSEFAKGQILYLTPGARVNSTFAGHYDLAVFLAMVITVIVALFLGFKKLIFRGYLVGIGTLASVVLVMTAARLSFLAVIAGVVSVILISKKWLYLGVVLIVTILALIYPSQLRDRFISTIKVNILDQGARFESSNKDQQSRSELNIPTLPSKMASVSSLNVWNNESTFSASGSGKVASDIVPGEPVDNTQLGVYRSFEIRVNIEWPRAINAFYKNPILGTGFSSLGIATDNDILRSLGEVGILGTYALALLQIAIFKKLWKLRKSRINFNKFFSIGLMGVIVAFVVNSLFIDVYEASKVATLYWILLGLGLSLNKYENN